MYVQTNYSKGSDMWASDIKSYEDKVFLNITNLDNNSLLNMVFDDTIVFAKFIDRAEEVLDELNRKVGKKFRKEKK